jgi:hypothetical protein
MINLIYENLFEKILRVCVKFNSPHSLQLQQSSLPDKDLYSGTKNKCEKCLCSSLTSFDVKATLAPKNYKSRQDVEIQKH